MADRRMVVCGVPGPQCTGSLVKANGGLKTVQAHSSHEEAFRCHRRWLISKGYIPVGPRELRTPNGGPVRVLTKKSRFGGSFRKGKEGTRYVPDAEAGHVKSGLIYSI